MEIDMENNCGACRWWAPLVKQPFIGVCGHEARPSDRSTDKLDTCRLFELDEVRHRIARSTSKDADGVDGRTTVRRAMEEMLT